MYIAVNRITAPPEAMERMTEGFRRNAASLKGFAGFIAFELWRGETALEAVSRWESREAYEAWRASDHFLAAHTGTRGGSGGSGGQGSQGGGSSVAYYEGEVMAER